MNGLFDQKKCPSCCAELTGQGAECAPQVADPEIEQRLHKVTELRSLCDAAERALRGGVDCPRLVKAMGDVVKELNAEGLAA